MTVCPNCGKPVWTHDLYPFGGRCPIVRFEWPAWLIDETGEVRLDQLNERLRLESAGGTTDDGAPVVSD